MIKNALIIYENCSPGGIGKVIKDRCTELIERGFKITLLFQNDRGGYAFFSGLESTKVLIVAKGFAAAYNELNSKTDFQIQINFSNFNLISPRALNLAEFHGSSEHNKKQLTEYSQNFEKVLVPSLWVKKFLGLRDIEVLPNALFNKSQEKFLERSASKRSKKNSVKTPRPSLVWVGRLKEYHKNSDDFCIVANKLKQQFSDLKLHVFLSQNVNDHNAFSKFLRSLHAFDGRCVEIYSCLKEDDYLVQIQQIASDERSVAINCSKSETFGLSINFNF